MSNFLFHIAGKVYREHAGYIDRVCMVFPNRRAGLFFSKYLSEISGMPIWAPAFRTINELMQDLSNIQVSESLELVFELYKVFREKTDTSENFDDFYFWGEMLLNDFDDIDKYMVNPDDLFRNLEALKNLEDHLSYLSDDQLEAIRQFWHTITPRKISSHKTDFIKIWSALAEIYKGFRSVLKGKGIGYEGMIYREVGDKILNDDNLNLEYRLYILAGFNALNPCENLLFSLLQKLQMAEFYWDYDKAYLNDKHHEAGYFIRKNLKQFPAIDDDFPFSHLEEKDKRIEIISVPSDAGQAKLIPQILGQAPDPDKENFHHTAVVLADEHILMPVLYSVPEWIEDINITMGYPLRGTPLYSLITYLIELQQRSRINTKGEVFFYHEPVLSILNHQYLKSQDIPGLSTLIREIKVNNRIYINADVFSKMDLLSRIFRKQGSPEQMSDYLMEILLFLFNKLDSEKEGNDKNLALDQEYVYHLYLAIQRLGKIVNDIDVPIHLDTYLKLLDKIVRSIKIPFTGEPLAGLQVLGILETRNLDFENLIILSMNEGILPRSQPASSFIPYNLRKGFGLPTPEHQDAIYSYYFYRLIQRAKHITLVYNSRTDGMKTGEMSRFLTQLKYNPNINVSESELGFEIQVMENPVITIPKKGKAYRKMIGYTGSAGNNTYLSPSGINTYLDCSLKFYFQYIAGMKEPEEISEEIDYACFGNILHKAVNLLYKPFKGKNIQEPEVTEILSEPDGIFRALIRSYHEELMKSSHPGQGLQEPDGINIVILEVLKRYVKKVLEVDINYLPFTILHLEENFLTRMNIPVEGRETSIRLGGTIDRIDCNGNVARIIDYKTGKGTPYFDSMEKLFRKEDTGRNKPVMQTFLYSFLVSDNLTGHTILPGLYYLREMYDEAFDFHIYTKQSGNNYIRVGDFDQVKKEFREHLERCLLEIFDYNLPFRQTSNEEFCRLCPYRKICRRW